MSAISEAYSAKAAKQLDSVAIIMDGNGRWAEKRGLPRTEGHVAGARAVPEVLRAFRDRGVRYITLYAFSTENWKRPADEVDGIMSLIYTAINDKVIPIIEKDEAIGFRFIGDLSPLSPMLRERCEYVSSLSSERREVCSIALNYGGRAEIVRAVNLALSEYRRRIREDGDVADTPSLKDKESADIARISSNPINTEKPITERELSSLMYTRDIPDPDLIIRTGGEMRLSNFLLWQSAYSELIFTDLLWPDVRERHVNSFIDEYYSRHRRLGGL